MNFLWFEFKLRNLTYKIQTQKKNTQKKNNNKIIIIKCIILQYLLYNVVFNNKETSSILCVHEHQMISQLQKLA